MYYNKVEICGVNTARLPTLTSMEKKELLRKTKNGDMTAREELIDGNLRLVLSIIQRFSGRRESMDDLFQVGCIGLIKAVDNFNPDLDVEFSTYAVPMAIEYRKQMEVHMTRKQALETALSLMEQKPEFSETAAVLREIIAELPLTGWSEKTIRDSVEQFIADHGRIPFPSDFGRRSLPPHTVIKNRYRMTCGEWLRIYYPSSEPEKKREVLTRKFTEEYRRIGPVSAREFDRLRNPSVPCSATVCRQHGNIRWSELLKILQLTPPGMRRSQKGNAVSVRVQSDLDF